VIEPLVSPGLLSSLYVNVMIDEYGEFLVSSDRDIFTAHEIVCEKAQWAKQRPRQKRSSASGSLLISVFTRMICR